MKFWHERCFQPCLFLCSIRQPFLRPDRALLLRRRAQTPSRSAVAQTTPRCPTSRGRTLDGGEHGGRLAWVGQKTIRRSGTANLEHAMLSPPSQLCAHGCIVPISRSGLLYNVREWERERPSNAVTVAPSNCVNGLIPAAMRALDGVICERVDAATVCVSSHGQYSDASMTVMTRVVFSGSLGSSLPYSIARSK
jgi:hypothetical protein